MLAHHTSSLLLNGPIYTNALDDEPKLNTSHNEPNNNLDMLDTGYSTANKIIAADENVINYFTICKKSCNFCLYIVARLISILENYSK